MQIRFPTEIYIQPDAIQLLADRVGTNYRHCLIVTGGARTRSTGLYRKTLDAITRACKHVDVIQDITSNPRSETIEAAVLDAKRKAPDCIVTVGGGSVHDAGKLIAVMIKQCVRIEDITVEAQGYLKVGQNTLPVFSVPLLVGTGAEVSPASLVRMNDQKRIVFSPFMYPRAAYYSIADMFVEDKEFCLITAFDAYVQSLEAFLSKKSTDWSNMFAVAGMTNAVHGMLAFSADPSSFEARQQVSLAAIQGLLAVSNSSVGAIHALSDPLSGIYNIHHGTALSVVAEPVLEKAYLQCAGKFEVATQVFCSALGDNFEARYLPALVTRLANKVAPNRLSKAPAFDLSEAGLGKLVADSRNPDMDGSPTDLSDNDIREIFQKALR